MLTHCVLYGAEATLRIRIEDWDTIRCPECEEEFSVSDLDERIAQMQALVRCCKAAREAMDPVTA